MNIILSIHLEAELLNLFDPLFDIRSVEEEDRVTRAELLAREFSSLGLRNRLVQILHESNDAGVVVKSSLQLHKPKLDIVAVGRRGAATSWNDLIKYNLEAKYIAVELQ